MVSIRLTDTQKKKIKKYGINRSEFVRRAVDYYLLYLEDPYKNMLLAELKEWIKLKEVTSVTHMSTDVTHIGTNVLYDNTNVSDCNTNNTTVTQKPTNDNLKHILKKELKMIQRQLNNPENSDTIPDFTLKILSKRHDISKSSIQAWIAENKQWLKETNFTEEW